jgi:hypothetical protein
MATDLEALAAQFGGTVDAPAAAPAPAAPVAAPAPAMTPTATPAPAAAPMDYAAMAAQYGGQVQPAAPEEMGFFESVGEMITGSRRATEATRTLPEWTSMPELNQMSVASFKTALGTLLTNPQETVQILQANFPGVQIRQDEKGNYILRSSVDQQEYAIPPGFSVGDIPRAIGGLAAFTPAGRAVTIPGAVTAAAATQAAIEASQAATGGEFGVGEVATTGAFGAAGPVVQRTAGAVGRGVRRMVGGAPEPTPATGAAVPPAGAAPVAPGMEAAETVVRAADEAVTPPPSAAAAPAVPGVAAQTTEEAFEEVGDLARRAAAGGRGSEAAKAKLADLAQVNPEAKAAADRLGLDLPFDVFADNPQVRAAVGLTRSVAGGEAEAAWVNTVRNAMQQADNVVQQFDAQFVAGAPAPGAVSQRVVDSLKATRNQLADDAKAIYQQVDQAVPKQSPVQLNALRQTLDEVVTEVGEGGLTAQEKRLMQLIDSGEATYGRLLREKNLIGQAIAGKDSPFGNMDAGTLKRLYAALANDQLDNVGTLAGDEMRRQLRGANLLTAKSKALENRMVGAFGRDLDGSIGNLMQSAITSAAKGDAKQFNKLMKVVPDDLRKEVVATALASVSSSKRAAQEGFGFAEFAKTYRGLRANPPVYKEVIGVLGKDADPVLRDLYEISKRITDARAQVLTTGKANQALVEAMKAEGLVNKVMQSSMAQRAVGAVAGMGGPIGGAVMPDVIRYMTTGSKDAVKAAGKLFASDDFQKLAIEAATKPQVADATVRKAAMSQAFVDFAKKARLPQALDARVQWLQNAMQTGRQFEQENQ